MPWLSIITVVKDDPEGFVQTMESIERSVAINAEASGIELVVVDGSTDHQQIAARIEQVAETVSVNYVSETPSGIYAAMNSALGRASGEYVYFLNAGDTLHDVAVLSELHEALKSSPVWAFGPVDIIELDNRVVRTPTWDYEAERAVGFSRGHFPAHQGTIIRRETLNAVGGFDRQFRIAADYAVALKLSQVAAPLVLTFPLATFREGGTSTQHWRESFKEFHRARSQILQPKGRAAIQERWNTLRQYATVYAVRELRPRLSWLSPGRG